MTPSPTTIAATAAAAADSGPRPPTANTNKKPNWRRHTATLGSALLLLCALLHPLLAARGFLGPGGCLLMVNAATAPAKAGSGSASAASSASSLLHVGHNRRGGAAAMEVQQQQEQQEQEKRGKQQGGAGGFAAALGEGGRRLVAKGARKLAGRVRAVLHREIEALQEEPALAPAEAAQVMGEEVVGLLRTLPEIVQEGHRDTMGHVHKGWATLRAKAAEAVLLVNKRDGGKRRKGQPFGRRNKNPGDLESLLVLEQEGQGQAQEHDPELVQAALQVHVQRVEQHAGEWVSRQSQEHLDQTLRHLGLIAEHAPKALDPSGQLDVIERLLVALRAATEGGLMPGADGRKRSMSDSQLRLVAAVQPEVMRMLDRLEKEQQQQQEAAAAGGGKDPRLHLCIAEALGFNLGTQRGLSAATCLGQVKRMSKSIERALQEDASLDSGLPYLIRGMYHLNCPPPLKSVSKARQCFHKALQVNPRSGRNLYFAGLGAFLEGDYRRAQAFYKQAQELLPAEMKRDASGQYSYLEQECQRGLALVHERLQGQQQPQQPQQQAPTTKSDAEGAVLLETGEGSFGGFVGWRRLVPGWVGGGSGDSRGSGGSLA